MKDETFWKKRSLFLILQMLLLLLMPLSVPAYAAGEEIWTITEDNGEGDLETLDLSPYRDEVLDIYDIVLKVAYPCAALSLAFGAIKMVMGDEQKVEAGKRQIVITVLALAALLLLPWAVNLGMDLGRTYGWSPP